MSDALPDVVNYAEYRLFLKDRYTAMKAGNAKFSHRYINAKVGAKSSGWISDILAGRQKLNAGQVRAVALAFKLDKREQEFLAVLVEMEKASNPDQRVSAMEKWLALKGPRREAVDKDRFAFFDHWYHLVLREVLGILPFTGDSLPQQFIATAVFQDKLWLLGMRYVEPPNSFMNNAVSEVWNSPDGVHWTEVLHTAPFEGRLDCGFAVYNGKLWVLGGQRSWPSGLFDVWSSSDGVTWSESVQSKQTPVYGGTAVGFGDKLLVIGGGSSLRGEYNYSILSGNGGSKWTSTPADPVMLPRMAHTVTEHAGRLWLIAGSNNLADAGNPKTFNDVWSSEDGLTWTLTDAHAPFTPRGNHTTLSLGGKLYVIGGYSPGISFGDVWVME